MKSSSVATSHANGGATAKKKASSVVLKKKTVAAAARHRKDSDDSDDDWSFTQQDGNVHASTAWPRDWPVSQDPPLNDAPGLELGRGLQAASGADLVLARNAAQPSKYLAILPGLLSCKPYGDAPASTIMGRLERADTEQPELVLPWPQQQQQAEQALRFRGTVVPTRSTFLLLTIPKSGKKKVVCKHVFHSCLVFGDATVATTDWQSSHNCGPVTPSPTFHHYGASTRTLDGGNLRGAPKTKPVKVNSSSVAITEPVSSAQNPKTEDVKPSTRGTSTRKAATGVLLLESSESDDESSSSDNVRTNEKTRTTRAAPRRAVNRSSLEYAVQAETEESVDSDSEVEIQGPTKKRNRLASRHDDAIQAASQTSFSTLTQTQESLEVVIAPDQHNQNPSRDSATQPALARESVPLGEPVSASNGKKRKAAAGRGGSSAEPIDLLDDSSRVKKQKDDGSVSTAPADTKRNVPSTPSSALNTKRRRRRSTPGTSPSARSLVDLTDDSEFAFLS
jgi:hypothetical protein